MKGFSDAKDGEVYIYKKEHFVITRIKSMMYNPENFSPRMPVMFLNNINELSFISPGGFDEISFISVRSILIEKKIAYL